MPPRKCLNFSGYEIEKIASESISGHKSHTFGRTDSCWETEKRFFHTVCSHLERFSMSHPNAHCGPCMGVL